MPIVAVYTDNGTKLVSYTYDAWGNHTTTYHNGGATTAAQYNPFRYRGYYYDTDLGLYYLNSRYYDSVVGRFINPDNSLYHNMLGYNMFIYCNNNPVNYYDFTGESAIAIGGLVLVFFGTILGLTSSEKQEATPEQIKNAQDAADKAELNPGTDEKGNYTVDIRIDTQETVDMVDEIAYDYFYERLYERTVEKALGDNQSIDALMDINHMRWEFSIHIFGNELNIENCKDTDLNVEETLWSMFKRFLEQ